MMRGSISSAKEISPFPSAMIGTPSSRRVGAMVQYILLLLGLSEMPQDRSTSAPSMLKIRRASAHKHFSLADPLYCVSIFLWAVSRIPALLFVFPVWQ